MAEPFLSEIRIFSFDFPPKGWAMCDGQFLPINQNQALFALIGTNYGGNGQTTFQLPNMRGRLPISMGSHSLAETGGTSTVTINQQTMPQHAHFLNATGEGGTSAIPGSGVLLATSTNYEQYRPASALTSLHPASVTNVGGSQAHTNLMPYLVLNFCIALQGIFPSQN